MVKRIIIGYTTLLNTRFTSIQKLNSINLKNKIKVLPLISDSVKSESEVPSASLKTLEPEPVLALTIVKSQSLTYLGQTTKKAIKFSLKTFLISLSLTFINFFI